ncbi:tRNA (adenine(22)-N(1))-methyltransferase [Lactococcus hodotermopsidis]|uniref:tRNA (adenine(22)-N(1))-methyltransferase n=1 Tax=Pseudolactococcus hodotermopsidis TaxID=2709157 RepID=UPI00280A7635|nr:tRNA (adenine(22)-N(1))-methyltransferase TrmK [Lactococcus hodotermopsidis]
MNEKLSKRLSSVADFVPENARLLDVGSDHAYLPINLVSSGKITFAIAGEVVEGPFNSACENVAQSNLTDKIRVRLANGLAAFEPSDKIDTITISGMGGHLIADILANGIEKLDKVSTLILQANNGEYYLRKWLIKHNFKISAEKILSENEKIYEILVVHHGNASELTEDELNFGPFLLKEKNDVFQKKWQSEEKAVSKILENLPETAEQKRQEFSAKLAKIKEILNVSA